MDLDRTARLASFLLQFARVERVTLHPDGIRPETDSDHTIMLAVIACDLCPPSLNRGVVAGFAIVHDLVETYAGDTQTLKIDAGQRMAKDAREAAAFARIREEFGPDSWMVKSIENYESQRSPEARYVKLLDKVLPKLTHTLNGCKAAKGITDYAGFKVSHINQYRELSHKIGGEPWAIQVLELLWAAMNQSEAAWHSTAPLTVGGSNG